MYLQYDLNKYITKLNQIKVVHIEMTLTVKTNFYNIM